MHDDDRGKHDRNVMAQTDNRSQTGIEVETNRDIHQHQHSRKRYALDGVVDEVTTRDCANAGDIDIFHVGVFLAELALRERSAGHRCFPCR